MLCHKPLQMKSQPVFPLVQKCSYWYQFYFFFFFNNSFVVTTYSDHFMCFDFFFTPAPSGFIVMWPYSYMNYVCWTNLPTGRYWMLHPRTYPDTYCRLAPSRKFALDSFSRLGKGSQPKMWPILILQRCCMTR